MIKTKQRGFTLVEILIVVALIAVLAVIALVTINPAEAQRKARDTRRVKDLGSIQGMLSQIVTDYPDLWPQSDVTFDSNDVTTNPEACDTGWLPTGLNTDVEAVDEFADELCNYTNVVPVDPLNRTASYANGVTVGGTTSGAVVYGVAADSDLNFRVCVRQESETNNRPLEEDGGTDDDFYEAFSITTASDCVVD